MDGMSDSPRHTPSRQIRAFLRDILPRSLVAYVRRYRDDTSPSIGYIAFGDFRRTHPIDERFGYGRGTPIDRVYIERFLAKHAESIRGRTLEVVDDGYTRRFGQPGSIREIVDVRPTNGKATIIGDVTNLGPEWDEQFDGIVLTQTLQLIFDVREAVKSLHRMLKPGGTLLATVPGITSLDPSEYDNWFWSFTEASTNRLFGDVFGESNVRIEVYGNVCSAATFLHGVAAEELKPSMLEPVDRRYPVIVAVSAQKM
jgi:hypothetical protein